MEPTTAKSPPRRGVPDREGPRRLPGARARGQRQAGRLPRQRRQRPAGAGLDPGGRPLRARPPLQRPPRLAHALGRGDRGLRGRPGDGRRPHRRRRPARGRSSSATRPRRSTSSPAPGATPTSARATASCSPRWSTTPTSSPGSSWPSGPGPRSTGCRSTDDGLLDMEALAALLERGPKLVAVTHVSNVLGTENPLAEISAPRPRRRRAGRSPTAPRRRRSCRSTWPRSASTSTRSPATSSTRRPGSARSGAGSSCCARCRPSSAAAR